MAIGSLRQTQQYFFSIRSEAKMQRRPGLTMASLSLERLSQQFSADRDDSALPKRMHARRQSAQSSASVSREAVPFLSSAHAKSEFTSAPSVPSLPEDVSLLASSEPSSSLKKRVPRKKQRF